MAKRKDPENKVVADNRKARYAYAIESTLEAGIVLHGSEVKALRGGKATIAESYAQAKDGEIFLVNAYIPEYNMANRFNHEPRRSRKVLVRKTEVKRLAAAIQREGMTLIPLRALFQSARHRQAGTGHRQRQETARQARNREAARLAARQGAAHAEQRLIRMAGEDDDDNP